MKGINSQSITFIIVVFIALVLFAFLKPKPTDWSYSFSLKGKNPFDLLIFVNELDSVFNKNIDLKFYFEDLLGSERDDFNRDIEFVDSTEIVTLMYVELNNNWDTLMMEKVLSAVAHGHSTFVSTTQLSAYFTDKLGIEIYSPFPSGVYFRDSVQYSLNLSPQIKIVDNVGVSGAHFVKYDTTITKVLGHVTDEVEKPNFLKISYGLGYFYIHTEPVLFTNYHMLRGSNYKYVESLLSNFSQENPIVWVQYYHSKKVVSNGVLRYIMSQPPLKWAWLLLLAGILLFIITHFKRPQRIIPIIPPIENTTLKFVGSIGDLYMRKSSIRHLMDRKIIYTLEKIRTQYLLSTDILDDTFIQKLTNLSGQKFEVVRRMIFLIQKHKETDYVCTADDLRRLSQSIENFYSYSIN